MGIFDALKFWKKEEDEFSLDEPLPGMEEQPVIPEEPAMPTHPSAPFHPGPAPSSELPSHVEEPSVPPGAAVQPMMSRDIELINSKLDAIRAILTSIEQRIAALERMQTAQQSPAQEQQKRMPW
jgi:hypothetical protein